MNTPAGPRRAPRSPRLFKRLVLRHTLTKTDLQATGRPRDPLAVALRLTPDEADFFPAAPFRVQTDDGDLFAASVSEPSGTGTARKTLRADPVTRFGEWLLRRKGAQVGDEIEVIPRPDGRYRFLHIAHTAPADPGGEEPAED
ncbi:MAG TPA: hypothetical protein VNK05_04455 [Chloroflexota bacterium]|nr:hypothetical protein [Chloroflexota bacterium]